MKDMSQVMTAAARVPWANSGKTVTSQDPEEILRQAGLDWEVLKVDTTTAPDPRLEKIIPLRKKALIRVPGNIILSDGVGPDWSLIQNSEAFDLLREVTVIGDMRVTAAGSFRKSNVVWAIARCRGSFDVVDGDRITSNVLFTHPHEYGKSIDFRFMTIRSAGMSTVTWSSLAQVHHRKTLDPDAIRELRGAVVKQAGNFERISGSLARKRITRAQAEEFFSTVWPAGGKSTGGLSAAATRAIEAYRSDETPGHSFATGTAWHAYSIVPWLCDHELGNSEDTRMTSSWYGKNHRLKLEALRLAVKISS